MSSRAVKGARFESASLSWSLSLSQEISLEK